MKRLSGATNSIQYFTIKILIVGFLYIGSFSTAQGLDVPSVTSAIIKNAPQLFPIAIIVAFVGLFGTVYKTKVDRAISSDSSSAKIFESVIKDNAALRESITKLATESAIKSTEILALQGRITQLEYNCKLNEKVLEEKNIIILRLKNSDRQKVIRDALISPNFVERLKELGISEEDIKSFIQSDTGESNVA